LLAILLLIVGLPVVLIGQALGQVRFSMPPLRLPGGAPPAPAPQATAVPTLEPTGRRWEFRNTVTGEQVILVGDNPNHEKVLEQLTPGPAPCGHAWGSYESDFFRSSRRCVERHKFAEHSGVWVPWDKRRDEDDRPYSVPLYRGMRGGAVR
jgi:hypothetical protein